MKMLGKASAVGWHTRDEYADKRAAQRRKRETRKTEKQGWSDEVSEELVSEDTDDYGYWDDPYGVFVQVGD